MPGMFRRAWDRVVHSGIDQETRRRDRQHRLSKRDRKNLEHRLVAGYEPKSVERVARRARTERDAFHLARAERKRYRRCQRRIYEAARGGWGDGDNTEM